MSANHPSLEVKKKQKQLNIRTLNSLVSHCVARLLVNYSTVVRSWTIASHWSRGFNYIQWI